MKKSLHILLAALGILALGTTMGQATVSFGWVEVGNAGNAADPLNFVPGIGSVATIYNIATKEVNISQYTEFLNAVAKTDINGLYNASMASNLNIAGITRTGLSGNYVYTAIAGSGNRPVTYVSWNDSARFVNWLHNGQGSGSTETGVYEMSVGTPIRSGTATYVIPSESEWYKAAYYDPTLNSGSGGYYTFPTKSNTAPGNTIGAGANQANYYYFNGSIYILSVTQSNSYSTSLNYLTDGGAFSGSASFYGTYDQGGNVLEWNDTAMYVSDRGARGGSWNDNSIIMQSSIRPSFLPTFESSYMGFRVASIPIVPEPSTSGLVLVLWAGWLVWKRWRVTI